VLGDHRILEAQMVPATWALDPLDVPPIHHGMHVVLEQQQRIATKRVEREQAPVLVPRDPAVRPAHDTQTKRATAVGSPVAAAVVGDHKLVRGSRQPRELFEQTL
jgi:hypothetical protein